MRDVEELQQSQDDHVIPFQVDNLNVRGRAIQLGPVIDDILQRHDYPRPVARVLGEALVLAVMLGTTLKFDGRFIMQTKTDGPINMLVVDFETPGSLRGCARFDMAALAPYLEARTDDSAKLLGKGYLAMTVDQGADMERYQGIVPLDGTTLEQAADEYFRQSEQIPSRVRLAVGEMTVPGEEGARETWRAGGVMVQYLPESSMPSEADFAGDDSEAADDHWMEARSLVETVEDYELIDPDVPSTRLLYRLFHEQGVTAYAGRAIIEECRCSREGVGAMLANFAAEERADMVKENGKIEVECEFCSENYLFTLDEFEPKA